MPRIAILGAGSAMFAGQLMTDLLHSPGLPQGTFALVDVDCQRLELAHRLAEHLIGLTGRDWSVQASADRTAVLAGCDHVISTIEVAGLRNVEHDYRIPLAHGVDQCIGDTLGPGGVFKALRTLPAWLEILADVERLAPGAHVLNYTNPMSITVLAGLQASDLPIIGLCHSVQNTARQLAEYLEVPRLELVFRVGGINHMAFFLALRRGEQDLYPRLRQRARLPEIRAQDPVRFDILDHLGWFVTESSGHFSEYVPYYRKRPDLIERYAGEGYLGESGYYARMWPLWRAFYDDQVRLIVEEGQAPVLARGEEYAAYIIEAIETDAPVRVHANVLNSGLIDNLPQDGVVEVPCLVDGTGVHPTHFGPLPTPLAALCQPHMAVHELVVEAVLARDRRAAFHALALDPLTAAVCSLEEIRSLFEAMVEAQKADLPDWLQT